MLFSSTEFAVQELLCVHANLIEYNAMQCNEMRLVTGRKEGKKERNRWIVRLIDR